MKLKWRDHFLIHWREGFFQTINQNDWCDKMAAAAETLVLHSKSKGIPEANLWLCLTWGTLLFFTNHSSLRVARIWSCLNKTCSIIINLGNSRFITNSLISSSAVFQDLIIKFKEYTPFIITIFFSNLQWRRKKEKQKKKEKHLQLHQKYEILYTHTILNLPIVLVSSRCLKEQHWLTVSAPDLRNQRYIFFTYPSSSFKT